MTKYVQTKSELLAHLKDQIAFMTQSASSYDNGFEGEGKRLATVIRVLLHDTPKSTSLLSLLGRKNIYFYDSARDYDPRNLLSDNCLIMMRLSTKHGASYLAPLDNLSPDRSNRKVNFDEWWGKIICRDISKNTFTRKDLVLTVANKEGGTHIDPKLDQDYANLSRFNSSGWKVFMNGIEKDFNNTPILPSIRQIAHEVLKTLKVEVIDLFPDKESILEMFKMYEEHCQACRP